MRKLGLGAVLLAAALAAGCVVVLPTTASLTVTNGYHQSIMELYVYPSGSASTGPNLIAGSPLGFNESVTVTQDPGYYDLQAVAADTVTFLYLDAYLTAGFTFTWTIQ